MDRRFPFDQKFRNFRNGVKLNGRHSLGKFRRIPKTVKFPKCEQLSQKFWKSDRKIFMKIKIRKFGYSSRGLFFSVSRGSSRQQRLSKMDSCLLLQFTEFRNYLPKYAKKLQRGLISIWNQTSVV